MAFIQEMTPQVGLVAGSVLLLVLGNASAQGENSTMPGGDMVVTTTNTTTAPPEESNLAAIIAPIVVLVVVAIAAAVLVYLFLVVRKKRQTEGTYRPSAEEQSGARSVEVPDALKLPKEERLI